MMIWHANLEVTQILPSLCRNLDSCMWLKGNVVGVLVANGSCILTTLKSLEEVCSLYPLNLLFCVHSFCGLSFRVFRNVSP
ncbi:hypothetical protein CY35_02G047000 [Sphagnum magellanicum]|nr:hypothetical protein CY35_02G047000 [Sphagnum magellanicum]